VATEAAAPHSVCETLSAATATAAAAAAAAKKYTCKDRAIENETEATTKDNAVLALCHGLGITQYLSASVLVSTSSGLGAAEVSESHAQSALKSKQQR
jgi:hypothetical protein